jgi:hypothetical protein
VTWVSPAIMTEIWISKAFDRKWGGAGRGRGWESCLTPGEGWPLHKERHKKERKVRGSISAYDAFLRGFRKATGKSSSPSHSSEEPCASQGWASCAVTGWEQLAGNKASDDGAMDFKAQHLVPSVNYTSQSKGSERNSFMATTQPK